MKNLHNIARKKISLTRDQETIVAFYQNNPQTGIIRYNSKTKLLEKKYSKGWSQISGTYYMWWSAVPDATFNLDLLEVV